MIKSNLITIKNLFDQAKIPAIIEEPASKQPKGWFVLLHGLTTDKSEYLNFYDDVARGLLECGYASIRMDFRAHGDSHSDSLEFNIVNNVSDVVSTIRWLLDNKIINEVNLFGTSFGAVATLAAATVLPAEMISRIYLLAPVLSFDDLYLNPTSISRKEKYGDMLRRVLLDDEKILLNERVSFNYKNAIEFALIDIPKIVGELAHKLTVMHGTHDTIVPLKATKKIVEKNETISYYEFDGMDHGFTDINDAEGTGEVSKNNLERIINILCKGIV